jgi:hypothetical protein
MGDHPLCACCRGNEFKNASGGTNDGTDVAMISDEIRTIVKSERALALAEELRPVYLNWEEWGHRVTEYLNTYMRIAEIRANKS